MVNSIKRAAHIKNWFKPVASSKLLDETKHEYRGVYFPRGRGKLALSRRVFQGILKDKSQLIISCFEVHRVSRHFNSRDYDLAQKIFDIWTRPAIRRFDVWTFFDF